MKLAFLCSSAAPGRDGVGDYTRRLAAACTARGHSCLVLALHDRHVAEFAAEAVVGEPQVQRWPATQPWPERSAAVRTVLRDFAPDWISWQMVAYGFQPKGILGAEITALAAALSGISTQVMLHELWIGLSRGETLWARVTGWRQRRALLAFLRAAAPRRLHTSNRSYAAVLARHGHEALVLPIFSNIPVHAASPAERAQTLAPYLPATNGSPAPLLAVTFGTLHRQWQPEATARFLQTTASRHRRSPVLLAIGRTGRHGPDILERLTRAGLKVIPTGELSPTAISLLLQAAELGIAPHPRALIAKSGIVAAMLDHGLPVLLPRDDWRLRDGADPAPSDERQLALLTSLDATSTDRWLGHRPATRDSLAVLAGVFLHGLAP